MDIQDDNNLYDEEKRDLIRPWEDKIDDTLNEEQNSRLLLFSCVYSFWEKSLQLICKYYHKNIIKKTGIKIQKRTSIIHQRLKIIYPIY